jgi:hypothetical protein
MQMRHLLACIVVAALFAGGCDAGSPTTGEFALSHFAVEGIVTNSQTGSPVSGTSVTAKIHDTACPSPHITLFELQTGNDGTFEDVLEFLELPSGTACVTFEVAPPPSTNLHSTTVIVPDVTVVRSTTPPDTIRVSIMLEPN